MIISTVWILIFIKTTTATPLVDFNDRSTGRNKGQTIKGIRFRDQDYDSSSFDPTNLAPKCSKGSTFCEKVGNYPAGEFTSILRETNKYTELFGSDLVNPITIGNRFGEIEDEEQLCASQVRLIYPQVGITKDNTWRYIINHSDYRQGVRVEECNHKGQCHMMQQLPFGFESKCKQKYVYRQLVAIDEEGKTIKDLFKIPSCCQCVLIRTQQNKIF